jgi:hypothetical protein
MAFLLPNGNRIDVDMLETAMEDADLSNIYSLNLQTGEVDFSSSYDDRHISDKEDEEETEEEHSVPVERIPSHEAYQWMCDFVDDIVFPKDALSAEKLDIALMGKGAFRRFKDVLRYIGGEWEQVWYGYRDDQIRSAMKEWLESLPVEIVETDSE